MADQPLEGVLDVHGEVVRLGPLDGCIVVGFHDHERVGRAIGDVSNPGAEDADMSFIHHAGRGQIGRLAVADLLSRAAK